MIHLPQHLLQKGSWARKKLLINMLNTLQNNSVLCVNYLSISTTVNNKDVKSSSKTKSCMLSSRAIVRLSGSDTPSLLQGLVTNDMNQLMERCPQIQYNMMLNVQGRVLYDLFLYNVTDIGSSLPTILVDVDCSVKEDLIKALKKYKIRKKVDITDVSDEYKIMTHWGQDGKTSLGNPLSFEDPRVPMFAHRSLISDMSSQDINSTVEEADYNLHRYKWGIPEGVRDLPPGACLPLESNLILMNGVSFQKGCYIGQELTARTFHTGVTRKRIMPIVLNRQEKIALDAPIKTEKKKNAGKFRNAEGLYGLGLLRLAHVKDSLSVVCQDGKELSLTVEVPNWWPPAVMDSSL